MEGGYISQGQAILSCPETPEQRDWLHKVWNFHHFETYKRFRGLKPKIARFTEVFGAPWGVYPGSHRTWIWKVTPEVVLTVSTRGFDLEFKVGMSKDAMVEFYKWFYDKVLGSDWMEFVKGKSSAEMVEVLSGNP